MYNPASGSDNKIYTVSEVNDRISSLFDLDPQLLNIAVTGELSNYKVYPSGHHYFTLKDAESSLKSVMFKTYSARLRFRPENGMKVIAVGKISVYPRDGAYQFYCNTILPAGLGDLQMQFEQLKARLSEEGLFDREHKQQLPAFPQKIAVVTSSAGAAVRDVIRILRQRWPLSHVVVVPVRVQGTEAAAEIAGAINFVNSRHLADLIITGRGGGSIEDLWPFNEEIVAKAIYRSKIPVISAVGHEPDVTISDYVADVRASTPSNAAELAVPDKNEMLASIQGIERHLQQVMLHSISAMRARMQTAELRISALKPENLINEKRMNLDSLYVDLNNAMSAILEENRKTVHHMNQNLNALGPMHVLQRGYSIVSSVLDGHVVKSVNDIQTEDRLNIRFIDGSINVICESAEEK